MNSNKKYYQTLLFFICYSIICVLSLIFATGVGNGIKLDDNQLIGYIVVIFCFTLTCFSFFVVKFRLRRIMITLVMILNILFVILPYVDLLNFNEGMFAFFIPSGIFFLLTLFLSNEFLISTRKLK